MQNGLKYESSMNRRVHLKDIGLLVCILIGVYLLYTLNECRLPDSQLITSEPTLSQSSGEVTDLPCFLNREVSKNVGVHASKRLQCLWNGAEAFVPFSFVKNYFDIVGSVLDTEHGKELEISSSSSRVFGPAAPYSPAGQFMHFGSFDVEARSRVLCVSAADGVPVSTQWDPEGYYYPTQIAQYSLSHYSAWVKKESLKNKQESPRYTVQLEKHYDAASKVRDEETNSLVIQFKDTLEFDLESSRKVLSMNLKVDSEVGAGVRVLIELNKQEQFSISYTQSNSFIQAKENMFIFGFGEKANNRWLQLTRNLHTDLRKGLAFINDRKRIKRLQRASLKVTSLVFYGSGKVANISLSDREDLRMFIDGANWFVKNQDAHGGWPSNVVFNPGRKKYPEAEEIPAGWYGAMCQGQAISVLCRAYHVTQHPKYLEAAEAALAPFRLSSREGGVHASFMGVYDWYEEYPTNPSTFILNGFMYSLIGLYDFCQTSPDNQLARQLYSRGMESLLAMLPLFDAGSGTFYDLRHVTMKTSPKLGRWDYHTTHINQLLLLSIIQNNTQLADTAERWRGYMVGKRAPHN